MAVKILLLIVFFAIMIGVGFYSRKNVTNVNDFVLGGRGVGPWLTAFAFGTSYFSSVVFVGYAEDNPRFYLRFFLDTGFAGGFLIVGFLPGSLGGAVWLP